MWLFSMAKGGMASLGGWGHHVTPHGNSLCDQGWSGICEGNEVVIFQ